MEVEDLLARAWAAVEKAGIPEPLHDYAFREALSRLDKAASASRPESKHAEAPAEAPTLPAEDKGSTTKSKTVHQSDLFAKFASDSDLPIEDLERAFFFNDGVPHLNVARTKLGNNAADQAKAVAVAITAAYDFALDKTPIAEAAVRDEVNRLRISVGQNWSRTMRSLQGAGWIGLARQKQFKTTNTTQEELRKILKNALGPSGE